MAVERAGHSLVLSSGTVQDEPHATPPPDGASSDLSGCLSARSTGAGVQVGAGTFEDFVGEGWVGVGDGT
jgi:hypothetical protein